MDDDGERLKAEVVTWLLTIVPPGVELHRRGRWLTIAAEGGPAGSTQVDLDFLVDPELMGGPEVTFVPGMHSLLDALQDDIVEATAEWWPEPSGGGRRLSMPEVELTGETLTAGYAVDGTWLLQRTFRLVG
jgi:hypothetical protein